MGKPAHLMEILEEVGSGRVDLLIKAILIGSWKTESKAPTDQIFIGTPLIFHISHSDYPVYKMSATKNLLPAEWVRERFRLRNRFHVNLLSEFVCTTLLLFLLTGIGAQFILTHGTLNSWININVGVGFSIALCVYSTYKTSGAQMNPAVSFAMVTLGYLPFSHFIGYAIVQNLGAFFGTALSYFVYRDQIHHFTGGLKQIAGNVSTGPLFCSFPPEHLSNFSAFVDQIAGTFLLVFCIVLIIDPRNKIPAALHPLFFGFTLMVIGNSYGMNLGYPINPARDFAPRLLALFLGYGFEVFSYHSYYFWIPVVAPMIGGPLGAWTYVVTIGAHITDPDESEKSTLENGISDEMKPLAKA